MNKILMDPRMGLPHQPNNTLGIGRQMTIPQMRMPIQQEITRSNMPETLSDPIDEVVDLNFIIKNKPKSKIVREFMKYNLASIMSEEDLLFSNAQ